MTARTGVNPGPDAEPGITAARAPDGAHAVAAASPHPAANDGMLRLLDVVRRLARPFELNDLLEAIIDAGREILGAERGTVFLYDDKTRELYATVATGAPAIRFSIDRGIAGQCARDRQTVNVPDCYSDARFNPEFDKRTGFRTRSLIAVPLVGLDAELVGVLQLLNPTRCCSDAQDLAIAEALAAQAAAAVQRVRLLDERMIKLKLERDLALARQIQMNVLPDTLPAIEGYQLAAFSQPADQTGGDIYDLVYLPAERCSDGRSVLLMLLADATGHGVGPAISVTQVRAMLRMAVRLNACLDDIVHHINEQLTDDLASSRFVTAYFGRLDPTLHTVEYHAAGQGPLLHYHARERRCEWHNASTIPMGVMSNPPMDHPTPMAMQPGDMLVLLTDGFYEYQDAAGQQLGRDPIGDTVDQFRHASAQHVLDAILAQLKHFAGNAPQLDDLTAVILRRQP